MNIIGKNIRQLRQKNGWSQGEVAKRLSISIPAFSKIETGINWYKHIKISPNCESIRSFNYGYYF